MTSVGTQPTGEPLYYLPSEVAAMLRCSVWWVKEQARKRRIPFSWIGGSYRFTAQHIDEIAALFERRPPGESAGAAPGQPRGRRPTLVTQDQTVRLTARPPRRARRAG